MSIPELTVDFEYNFVLIGIVSPAKDYKLAWLLNHALPIHLIKARDLVLETNKDSSIVIANFIFKTAHCTFRLLKNNSVESTETNAGYLLPDQKSFDYLLRIDDQTDSIDTSNIINRLNGVREIDRVHSFDVNTLLFKENLIF